MAGYTSLFLLIVGSGCALAAHLPALHFREDAEESTSLGIYHGQDADIKSYPFMASVHCTCGGLICTGAIVSNQWVLVSGDCAKSLEPGIQSVTVGSANVTEGSHFKVAQTELHPKFGEKMLDFNVGLLRINGTFQWTDSVAKVGLPTDAIKVGTQLTITGWGPTDSTSEDYPLLQKGQMKTISKEQCEKAYRGYGINFTDTMGCVYNKGKTTPCGGDMSSPLTRDGVLHYLVTAIGVGGRCTNKALPAISSVVQPMVSWITQITGSQA